MPITIDGSGSITGVSAGGLPDNTVTTAELQDAAVTPAKLAQKLTADTVKSATGTAVDFTGIPSWVQRITVMLAGVSASGTDQWWLRLGDSGGFQTSGYAGSCTTGAGNTATLITNAFIVASSQAGTDVRSGVLTLVKITGNQWVLSGYLSINDAAASGRISAGQVTLSGTLTQIRVLTAGTNTFDAGSINVLYE